MNEFSAVVDDLMEWDASYGQAHLSTDFLRTADSLGDIRHLHSELFHTAVLVSVVASAANALERNAADRALLKIMTDFCPQNGASSSLDIAARSSADRMLFDQLQDVYARLGFACMLTRHLAGPDATDAARAGDAELLADAWRRACASFLGAFDAFSEDARRDAFADTSQRRVIDLLGSCCRGETPCLGDGGQLQVPGWAERRSIARVKLDQSAVASVGDQAVEVSVMDASRDGLGFVGDVAEGQRTTIAFADGRRVSGVVKWSVGGRFGLALDQPLAPIDPWLVKSADSH